MGKPPRTLSELAPGMALHTEVGTGLGLAVGSCPALTPGTEEDTPPELALGTSLGRGLGRGPGRGAGTPLQPLPGTALGSFEDTEEARMAACSGAR